MLENAQSERRVKAPKPDTLPISEKLAYGMGIIGFNLSNNGVQQLAFPIFGLVMGVSPAYIGIALGISRIWDSFTDPFMGSFSDNTRGRFGRRRPYILIGSILCALFFALIWFVPENASEAFAFIYFLTTIILFYTAFTVFAVPYQALGYELTPDHRERTRVMVIRAYFAKVILFILPWIFRLAQLEIFDNTMQGMRVIGCLLALLLVGSALPSFFFCKERYANSSKLQQKTGFIEALKLTVQTRPFMILLGITVLLQSAAHTVEGLGVYLATYYVCQGDLRLSASIIGLGGTLNAAVALIAIWPFGWLATRFGKKRILSFCLWSLAFASLLKWFFYRPDYPWLMVIVPVFTAPGIAAFWVLINSMKADICDYDELHTGKRREGLFAGLATWIQKAGLALTFGVSGFAVTLSGFNQDTPVNQQMDSVFTMRILFTIIPFLSSVAGLVLLRRYILTDERLDEIRLELENRRGRV